MEKRFLVIVIVIIAFMACKTDSDTDPVPIAQSKMLSGVTTIGGSVNVKINYTALPGVVPTYMSTLETVIINILQNANIASGRNASRKI